VASCIEAVLGSLRPAARVKGHGASSLDPDVAPTHARRGMTERLYYADSYLTEFEATVVAHGEGGRVYLDRSAFYPTSGGQPFDRGLLRGGGSGGPGLAVLDVVDEGERVAHVLGDADARELADGERVTGHIDWARRFDHMQQHSGQHLLSAVFFERLGLATLSVHFGAETSTLDLDTGSLGAEPLLAVEARANELVFEDRPVSAAEEEAPEGLRKESARSGPLRIVSIAALDRSACGGTHVRRTGEIGPILLRKLDRVRRTLRVEFVCGGRATRRARADYDALARVGAQLSASVDDVAEVVSKRLAELQRDSAALRAARESLDGYQAAELYARARASADGGRVLYLERRAEGSVQELHGLARAFITHPSALFIAALDRPPAILLAASADTGVDAGAVLKAALAAAGGRGGGSARIAQGSVENAEALAAVLRDVRGRLG
jgi:alanyl-tRNA synthetase